MMMNNKVNLEGKPLDYYLKLNYPITVYPDREEGGDVAEIKDLCGVSWSLDVPRER